MATIQQHPLHELVRYNQLLKNKIFLKEMSNFSLEKKEKLIGIALIIGTLLICIRCCQRNVKGNVFNIVDEKKWGKTSSHLMAKLVHPPN